MKKGRRRQGKKEPVPVGAGKAPGEQEVKNTPEAKDASGVKGTARKKTKDALVVTAFIAGVMLLGVAVLDMPHFTTTKEVFNAVAWSIEYSASKRAWKEAAPIRESAAISAPKGINAYLTVHKLHGTKLPDGLTIAFSTLPSHSFRRPKPTLAANGFATVSNWHVSGEGVINQDERGPSYCNLFRIIATGAAIGTQRPKPPVEFYQAICIKPPLEPGLG